VGKYKKRPTMRVMLTRIDGGACGEGSSVPMPWPTRCNPIWTTEPSQLLPKVETMHVLDTDGLGRSLPRYSVNIHRLLHTGSTSPELR
jgi:hypothetical protein